ncbi:kinetochore protein NDC80 homolog isoform X2 [Ixodes scapularis]|uniref:kinetochore protein NDC80 homolog isoform X2 n=1 Tax=Ixodes scapularis TaxID=6945 RepID=UPI001C388D20|nr:kinetochore protein NDC80 homolog isoform X2 [Ixodes scapularis]
MNQKSGFGLRGRRSRSANALLPRSFIPRRSSSFGDLQPSGGASLAPGPGSRHYNLRGNRGTIGSAASSGRFSRGPRKSVKDERPLADKTYQAECAAKLSEFLQVHGYANRCTSKQLLRMSTKDFERIFRFLVTLLDPNFKIVGKLEDAALQCLKRLGYPYTLSKSMLMGIGSRLPQALAVIMWLYDIVSYYAEVDVIDHLFGRQPGSGNDDAPGHYAADLLLNCLDNPDADDSDCKRFLQSLAQQVPQEDDKLDEDIQRERKVLADMEARAAKYEEVQMELKETRTKIQMYDLYFEKMMQHSEATKFGTQEASKSLADAEAEKVMLKAELCELGSGLQEKIQRQEDEVSFNTKRSELQDNIRRSRNQIEALKEEHIKLQMGWKKEHEKLQDVREDGAAVLKLLEKPVSSVLRGQQSAVLRDFDLRPVFTEEDVQQQESCNEAASAQLSQLMTRVEEKLCAYIKNEKELFEKYEFDIENITMELRWDQRIAEKSKACAEAVVKQLRDEQEAVYEQLEKALAEIAELSAEQRTSQATQEEDVGHKKSILDSAKRDLKRHKTNMKTA